jgi:hypothetical protein
MLMLIVGFRPPRRSQNRLVYGINNNVDTLVNITSFSSVGIILGTWLIP